MPTRIIAILARLRQDVAVASSPESIEKACEEVGFR
jgi:hypothetical protein